MQKKTFAVNDGVIVVSDDTYNGRKGRISGIPYNDWDAYFVTLESGEIDLPFFWDELEPADAPAPEAATSEPTTNEMIAGIREMPEAALAVGSVLVDDVHTLRAELERVKAERDRARNQYEREVAEKHEYMKALARTNRERDALQAFAQAYMIAAATEWESDYRNWMMVADFHLNEKNETSARIEAIKQAVAPFVVQYEKSLPPVNAAILIPNQRVTTAQPTIADLQNLTETIFGGTQS